jgi:hypothetical protein
VIARKKSASQGPITGVAPQLDPGAWRAPGRAARKRVGIGLVGFGWLGQAHTRPMQRIRTLFPERGFDPELVICSDTVSSNGQVSRARESVAGPTHARAANA